MKKLLFIFLVTITTVANAQNAVPQSATDIAPLLIREKIPNVILKSNENADVQLSDLLKKKKSVLVFYRV